MNWIPMNPIPDQMRYLNHLAKAYPSVEAVAEAIINLQAQLNLPKGTEHFISDIHGEFDAFARWSAMPPARSSAGSPKFLATRCLMQKK
jgi:hypothetical protein